jgi:hypothetical protein
MQTGFDFSADVNLPVAGLTPSARHASSTGAQRAARDRGPLALAYLGLLKAAGPDGLSDFEAARALGRMISSMCSTRNGLGDLVVPSGSFESSEFGTRRCRYTVKR